MQRQSTNSTSLLDNGGTALSHETAETLQKFPNLISEFTTLFAWENGLRPFTDAIARVHIAVVEDMAKDQMPGYTSKLEWLHKDVANLGLLWLFLNAIENPTE